MDTPREEIRSETNRSELAHHAYVKHPKDAYRLRKTHVSGNSKQASLSVDLLLVSTTSSSRPNQSAILLPPVQPQHHAFTTKRPPSCSSSSSAWSLDLLLHFLSSRFAIHLSLSCKTQTRHPNNPSDLLFTAMKSTSTQVTDLDLLALPDPHPSHPLCTAMKCTSSLVLA